jgi:pilus assembly protein CpaB
LEKLEGRFPRQRLYAGEPILTAKLMDSNGDVGSLKIPEGYRAVSIKVTIDTSVSGLVLPGDRVDIIAFLRKSGDIPKTMTRAILRDVRVFAVNAETERSFDAGGKETAAKTISVLVKHTQVESLMLAHEMGNLRLSLRRPNDASEENGEGAADIDTLLGHRPERADEPNDNVDNAFSNSGFVKWLKSQHDSQPQPAPPGAPTTEAANIKSQLAFKMLVLKPDGPEFYHWRDLSQLPEVVPVGSSGLSTSVSSDPVGTDSAAESRPHGSHVEDDMRDHSKNSEDEKNEHMSS